MATHKKSYSFIGALAVSFLAISTAQTQDQPTPPDPRSRNEVESVLAKAPRVAEEDLRELHIVLLASEKDHGLHEHDYPLWQKNWALLLGGENSGSEATQVNMFGPPNKIGGKLIKTGAAKVRVATAWEWPSEKQFQTADLIVAFSVMNWNKKRNAELKQFLSRGGGLVITHMSCVVADGTGLDEEVVDMIGLSWHWDYTRWRHGPMNLDIAKPDHPICLGLPKQLYFLDEAYWPLYGDRSKVTTIATSKETDGNFALRHKDGKLDFSNMAAIQQKWPQEPTKDEPMFWTYEYGKGRIFGSILGHYSWTFDDPYFRILLLRGMAWAAGESPYRFDSVVLRGAMVK
ncbi:MAG: ThuA domain-containing protein [Saprospiraceae bacterium]|nr:ThuA domain-containing protein [Saprospiraceae bacterium]